ncbi:MAG: 4Fe-4S dicluster domain-containing protein [Deltaproteobacteria bacterium]|jgi:ferredoxin|nr:4Fe-4S dicluster domain-containing protein [Deltaproteobacteria bacterium]
MPEYIVEENALKDFLQSISKGRVLLSPQGVGDKCQITETTPDKVTLNFTNTHISPKTLFFPQTEWLMSFQKDHSKPHPYVYQDLGDKAKSAVVFGIRPCDAKGLSVSNKVFQNDRFTDPYWKGKYESVIKVGLACKDPFPQCFCVAMGGSPYGATGLDVLAFPSEKGLGLKPITDEGAKLLAEANLKEADLSSELKSQEEAAIKAQGIPDDYSPIDHRGLLNLFQDPQWQSIAENCLNCGVCTFICPTCHCFDIQDEENSEGGVRMRNWDTCMSWLFTVHGTGHNPRPSKTERVRQRFMHKLKYIPMKQNGDRGCTGCGRCVVLCPVNIDIRSVALRMSTLNMQKQA